MVSAIIFTTAKLKEFSKRIQIWSQLVAGTCILLTYTTEWCKTCTHSFADLLRHAACHLHSSSVKFRADSESGWYPGWEPPLLQPAWLQRDPHRPWIYHRCHQKPRDYRRDSALPVQCGYAQCQLSKVLSQLEPRGLPVGVQQLLRYVWATQWMWRIHRHWWSGESYQDCYRYWPFYMKNILFDIVGQQNADILNV